MADVEKRPDKCWSSEFEVESDTSGLVIRFARCSRFRNITDYTFGHTDREKGLPVVKLEDTTAESRVKAIATLSGKCVSLCQDCTLFHPAESSGGGAW